MAEKPKVNSDSQKELEKLEKKFDEFQDKVDELTLDRMNQAPKLETEPQTQIAQKDLEKSKDVYLKPFRTISSSEKFNDKFRDDYNFKKEYVQFVAENKEVIGETIEMWTKPFPGMPAELWNVPVNKPVWAPRYVAEQIKGCTYHRLKMENNTIGQDGYAAYHGNMVVDNTIQRLDAVPFTKKKSIFMGAAGF